MEFCESEAEFDDAKFDAEPGAAEFASVEFTAIEFFAAEFCTVGSRTAEPWGVEFCPACGPCSRLAVAIFL